MNKLIKSSINLSMDRQILVSRLADIMNQKGKNNIEITKNHENIEKYMNKNNDLIAENQSLEREEIRLYKLEKIARELIERDENESMGKFDK